MCLNVLTLLQETRQQLQATQKVLEDELQGLVSQASTLEAQLAAEPAKQRALALQVQLAWMYVHDIAEGSYFIGCLPVTTAACSLYEYAPGYTVLCALHATRSIKQAHRPTPSLPALHASHVLSSTKSARLKLTCHFTCVAATS